MKMLTPITYYHITKPSPIRWEKVTEYEYFFAQQFAMKRKREYSSCTIFSCENTSKRKRKIYILFKGEYYTADIPYSMQFIQIVEQLDTEAIF